MRQTIIDSLEKLFSGSIDSIKITYYTSKSHDIIKFMMLDHGIREENGLITVYDDREHNDQIIPKTVNIDPLVLMMLHMMITRMAVWGYMREVLSFG